MERFNSLDGVPLRYDRSTSTSYGTVGIPYNPYSRKSFIDKLEACFKELFQVCPLGKPNHILSGGAWTQKPGMHGQGRAFDLDGLLWDDYRFVTVEYPSQKKFYLAVDAVLRKHFGIVLNYKYNRAHEDHFHIDDSVTTSFSKHSKSKVLALQMGLTHVHGNEVIIDGIWGSQTLNAVNDVLDDLDIQQPITQKAGWFKYLDATATKGFADVRNVPSLEELFAIHHEMIENAELATSVKHGLVASLNAIMNHEDLV
jgi:hypothetical protein